MYDRRELRRNMFDLILTVVVWGMGVVTGLGLGTAIATARWEKKYYADLTEGEVAT
jgi:hypothetical protein